LLLQYRGERQLLLPPCFHQEVFRLPLIALKLKLLQKFTWDHNWAGQREHFLQEVRGPFLVELRFLHGLN
jgi:hypothetical protein